MPKKKKKKSPKKAIPPPDPAKVAALAASRAYAARVRAIELQNPYGTTHETALDAYRNGSRPEGMLEGLLPHEEEEEEEEERQKGRGGERRFRQETVFNGAAERQRLARLHLLGPRFDVNRKYKRKNDKTVSTIYNVHSLRDFRRADVLPEKSPESEDETSMSSPSLLAPLRGALGRPSTSPVKHSLSHTSLHLLKHPRSEQKADLRAVLGSASAAVKKCSLAPSGRSALFSGGDPDSGGGGMLAFLRSPHLDHGEVRALHLNEFNAGVGQFNQYEAGEDSLLTDGARSAGSESVLGRNDKCILMQIMSKCRSLQTLEVAGLKTCVRNEAVRQLGMCPHLKTVDISKAEVSPQSLLEGLNHCPMIAHLILRSCSSLFNDGANGIGAGAKFFRALMRKKSLRLINLSEISTLSDRVVVDAMKMEPTASCGWTHLDLSRCPNLGDVGLGLLLPSCPKLCELKLSGCDQASLTDKSFESLGTSCVEQRKNYLKKLDISGLNQLQAGTGLLSTLKNCTSLEVLSLSGLGLEGNLNSACLTAITLLPRLDSLDVSGSSRFVSTKFLYALVMRNGEVGEHQGLSGSIRVLNVTGCRAVNEEVIRSLKKCKAGLTVVWSPPIPPRIKPLAPVGRFKVSPKKKGGKKRGKKRGKKKKKKKKKRTKSKTR
eukprot:g3345.t1